MSDVVEPKNQPVAVKVANGVLSITIGISALAFVTKHNGDLDAYDEVDSVFLDTDITDELVFANEVRRAMNEEDESGESLLHRMLDKAALIAIENGADGVVTGDDKLRAIRRARLVAEEEAEIAA